MNDPIAHSSALPLNTIDGEARVDSRVFAVELGVDHKNTYELVKNYSEQIQEFGILTFQTEEIAGRGQPERFVLLNEDQSYFLLTLTRNTPKAVEFKKRLVQSFSEFRRKRISEIPDFDDPIAAAEAWISERKARLAAEAASVIKQAQIEADRPKVEFHDEVAKSDTELHIRDVVKLLIGHRPGAERRLVEWMQAQGWLEKGPGRVASRWALSQGLLRRRIEFRNGLELQVTVVTGRGLTLFRHLFRTGELWTGGIDPARLLAAPVREV